MWVEQSLSCVFSQQSSASFRSFLLFLFLIEWIHKYRVSYASWPRRKGQPVQFEDTSSAVVLTTFNPGHSSFRHQCIIIPPLFSFMEYLAEWAICNRTRQSCSGTFHETWMDGLVHVHLWNTFWGLYEVGMIILLLLLLLLLSMSMENDHWMRDFSSAAVEWGEKKENENMDSICFMDGFDLITGIEATWFHF